MTKWAKIPPLHLDRSQHGQQAAPCRTRPSGYSQHPMFFFRKSKALDFESNTVWITSTKLASVGSRRTNPGIPWKSSSAGSRPEILLKKLCVNFGQTSRSLKDLVASPAQLWNSLARISSNMSPKTVPYDVEVSRVSLV